MGKILVYIMWILFVFVLACMVVDGCEMMSDKKKVERVKGEYRNAETGERQIQYQGSTEQRRDLDAIDEYSRSHPDF